MTKYELIDNINNIVEFITNGTVEKNGRIFKGHPAFYLIHSKEEFQKKLNQVIKEKESYNRYDLYYYMNYMFKYMLNQYDSHTQIYFMEKKVLPIKVRIINNIPYIVDCHNNFIQFKGSKILKINGIDIDNIMNELEKIICYSSIDYLKIMLEKHLTNANVINSLPLIESSDFIIMTTSNGDITFNLNNLDEYYDKYKKENYNLEVIDSTAIITYNSCRDEEKMIKLIEQLSSMDYVNKYIIDLRENGGGNSAINNYLIDYLNGKNIIALCDERVFSSARMCLINLKNIGAKIIGTNPGTPISCFGNCVMQKKIENMNLMVMGSATYWYYDDNLKCHGIYKNEFDKAISDFPNLLKQVFFEVDEKVELSLDDYINNYDSVINYALSAFENEKNK